MPSSQISTERNFRKSARGSEDSSSQHLNVLSPSKTLKRSTRLYIQEEADIQELPPWEKGYKHISLLAKNANIHCHKTTHSFSSAVPDSLFAVAAA
jgi:hypothetical protein